MAVNGSVDSIIVSPSLIKVETRFYRAVRSGNW